MKRTIIVTAAALLAYAPASFAADKADAVKSAVASACGGKTVASSDVPRLVKQLFVSCDAGADVDIDGCKVKCLK